MSYKDTRGEEAYQGNEEPPIPCGWCKTLTKRSVLSMFGARCSGCYRNYCHEVHSSPNAGDKRHDGPKGWAHALKTREENGAQLSSVQRSMWRDALGAA